MDIKLTIVTPTYNRGYMLKKVYNSLLAQTNMSFKWLIIDDGSIDDTYKIIDEFIRQNVIQITYIKKENGGKASALNLALDYIDTQYCCCLDSDDYFTNNAVEISLKLLEEEGDNPKCCGICGLRSNPDGTVMGLKRIPASYKYITIMQIYNDLDIKSEFVNVYKSEIAKKYRFPIIKGERFMPPSWFHYKLNEKYVFRTVFDSLCVCEYKNDGLTKNKRLIVVKNPVGYTLIKRISFQKSTTLKSLLKHGIMYDCGCIVGNDKQWLSNAPYKLIALLLYPIAYCVYLLRFRKIVNNVKYKNLLNN